MWSPSWGSYNTPSQQYTAVRFSLHTVYKTALVMQHVCHTLKSFFYSAHSSDFTSSSIRCSDTNVTLSFLCVNPLLLFFLSPFAGTYHRLVLQLQFLLGNVNSSCSETRKSSDLFGKRMYRWNTSFQLVKSSYLVYMRKILLFIIDCIYLAST